MAETAVAVLDEGRTLFDDLVRSDKDLLLATQTSTANKQPDEPPAAERARGRR